jgi:hypothetical protein
VDDKSELSDEISSFSRDMDLNTLYFSGQGDSFVEDRTYFSLASSVPNFPSARIILLEDFSSSLIILFFPYEFNPPNSLHAGI